VDIFVYLFNVLVYFYMFLVEESGVFGGILYAGYGVFVVWGY
jgi:hypothetical protein